MTFVIQIFVQKITHSEYNHHQEIDSESPTNDVGEHEQYEIDCNIFGAGRHVEAER